MVYILINWLPILIAAVAGFAFGAAYYAVLGKPWMAAAGLTPEKIEGPDGKTSSAPFIIAFIAEFWIASILAGSLILAPEEAGEWVMAIGTAVVIWIGFVVPVMVVNHRYQMAPWSLTFIDAGHWLGVMLLHVIVLQSIGVTPPPGAPGG